MAKSAQPIGGTLHRVRQLLAAAAAAGFTRCTVPSSSGLKCLMTRVYVTY